MKILGKVCVHYHMRLVSRSDSALVVLEVPGRAGCAIFNQNPEIVLMDNSAGPCRLIPAGAVVTMGHDGNDLTYLQREDA